MNWVRIKGAQDNWVRGDVITKAAPDEYIACSGDDYIGVFHSLDVAKSACGDRHASSGGGILIGAVAFVLGLAAGILAGWL